MAGWNNERSRFSYKLKLGTYTYKDGMKYVGGFVDGQKSGNGVYYAANGDKYEGDWIAGLMHGNGTLSFSLRQNDL